MQDQFLTEHETILMSRNPHQTRNHIQITRHDPQFVPFFLFQHNHCINIFTFQKREWLFFTNDLR